MDVLNVRTGYEMAPYRRDCVSNCLLRVIFLFKDRFFDFEKALGQDQGLAIHASRYGFTSDAIAKKDDEESTRGSLLSGGVFVMRSAGRGSATHQSRRRGNDVERDVESGGTSSRQKSKRSDNGSGGALSGSSSHLLLGAGADGSSSHGASDVDDPQSQAGGFADVNYLQSHSVVRTMLSWVALGSRQLGLSGGGGLEWLGVGADSDTDSVRGSDVDLSTDSRRPIMRHDLSESGSVKEESSISRDSSSGSLHSQILRTHSVTSAALEQSMQKYRHLYRGGEGRGGANGGEEGLESACSSSSDISGAIDIDDICKDGGDIPSKTFEVPLVALSLSAAAAATAVMGESEEVSVVTASPHSRGAEQEQKEEEEEEEAKKTFPWRAAIEAATTSATTVILAPADADAGGSQGEFQLPGVASIEVPPQPYSDSGSGSGSVVGSSINDGDSGDACQRPPGTTEDVDSEAVLASSEQALGGGEYDSDGASCEEGLARIGVKVEGTENGCASEGGHIETEGQPSLPSPPAPPPTVAVVAAPPPAVAVVAAPSSSTVAVVAAPSTATSSRDFEHDDADSPLAMAASHFLMLSDTTGGHHHSSRHSQSQRTGASNGSSDKGWSRRRTVSMDDEDEDAVVVSVVSDAEEPDTARASGQLSSPCSDDEGGGVEYLHVNAE
jgi:hypothetical protein